MQAITAENLQSFLDAHGPIREYVYRDYFTQFADFAEQCFFSNNKEYVVPEHEAAFIENVLNPSGPRLINRVAARRVGTTTLLYMLCAYLNVVEDKRCWFVSSGTMPKKHFIQSASNIFIAPYGYALPQKSGDYLKIHPSKKYIRCGIESSIVTSLRSHSVDYIFFDRNIITHEPLSDEILVNVYPHLSREGKVIISNGP